MEARFELVAVAFLRGVGGRLRVLLAIDRDGEQLFDGEPALLVEHRPGSPSADLVVDGADGIEAAALELVHAQAHEQLASLIDAAFDDSGEFVGERLLGRGVQITGERDCFGTM